MNRQPILDSWASGELFGISEQFARGGIELSGISGWFALASAAQILPRGGRPRHATSHLADATDHPAEPPSHLSRRPDHPAEPPSQSAGRPGQSAGRPGELSRRPDESDGRPSEPDGPGAARREGMDGPRRPGAARRERLDGPRTGLVDPRKGGLFVPEGRRAVATGGAQGRRPERNPWTGIQDDLSAPEGRRSVAARGGAPVAPHLLCPSGAGEKTHDAFHGLRIAQSSNAPPVATALDPSGVERRGHARRVFDAARAIGARGGAGGVHVRRGEVPEAPIAARPSGLIGAGGSGVRRG